MHPNAPIFPFYDRSIFKVEVPIGSLDVESLKATAIFRQENLQEVLAASCMRALAKLVGIVIYC